MKLSILIPVRANLLYTFQCETPCKLNYHIFGEASRFVSHKTVAVHQCFLGLQHKLIPVLDPIDF